MGCVGSKKKGDGDGTTFVDHIGAAGSPEQPAGRAKDKEQRLLPTVFGGRKVPPTMEEAALAGDEVRGARLSVRYQAKELLSGRASRRSSTPFDRARIGTHTRHGIMPGPRGFSSAKINQDRGVVCWPFNGSYNQALLCVFDGHGSKGERASEFCMKTIPELLENHSPELKSNPDATLSKVVCQTDQLLLGGELGRVAMTCGTTSTVVYLHGSDCYTACSGDSRAVKGSRQGGALVAHNLSYDHKPDLPEERERITACGGTVSDGSAGRPARVWAQGRIGLAMSRSLGDGECKAVGVIPDPSLSHVTIDAASSTEGDGDLFIIVASDGVWEFIESEEACRIVGAHLGNATEACTALVQEAAARWKRFEGSYRDDITAIVALLPFLEAGWADEDEEEEDGDEVAPLEEGQIFINAGMKGLSKVTAPGAAEGGGQAAGQAAGRAAGQAGGPAAAEQESASEREEAEKNEFASRRLSVHNPFDEDWNEEASDGEDEAAEPSSPTAPP